MVDSGADVREVEDFQREFRGVAGQLASGVSVLLTLVEGEPHATTIGSLVVASFDPPLVGAFVASSSRTRDYLTAAGRFSASILGAGDHLLAARLARPGRAGGWKSFDEGELVARDKAPPVVAAAIAWLDCAVERVVEVGDHSLVVGAALEIGRRRGAEPLLYYRGTFYRLGGIVGPGRHLVLDPGDMESIW